MVDKKNNEIKLNPATIRGILANAGLPGIIIRAAMTAYDQYETNTKMERSNLKHLTKQDT